MDDSTDIAERVRRACIDTALAAYEDAGIQGLCGEGRWEYAIDAVRRLDLGDIVRARATGAIADIAEEES